MRIVRRVTNDDRQVTGGHHVAEIGGSVQFADSRGAIAIGRPATSSDRMPVHSKFWYLRGSGLLDALSESARQRLVQGTRMLEVKRGQHVYLPGDPSDEVFLLKSGVIKIAAVGHGHREAILAFLYAGDLFGELAIVDDSPRDHLAEAHEDAVLCAIGKDVMLRLMHESPELGYRITKYMGSRLKQLHTRLEQVLYKSAAARIAETLVGLASEHGVRDARGVIVPFRLSQRELANLVGLTRETVNLVLHDLRQRELIEIDRGRIRLLDLPKLRAIR